MTEPTTTTTTTTTTPPPGGIAWAGSLVGSNRPDNLGFRYSHAHKRYRRSTDGDTPTEDDTLPAGVVVQFRDREGTEVGGLVDLPTVSDVEALSSLVHSLLNDEDGEEEEEEGGKKKKKVAAGVPYSFYAKVVRDGVEDDIEVTSTLANLIREHGISTEEVVSLTYQPLAIFRVRPVTRCSDTMPGHTEAVLHVSYSPDGKHLASGGGDTSVRFWDVRTSLPRHTCLEHKNHVLCTAWSPDGRRFASADKNGLLILWDPFKGIALAKIKAHTKWITDIAWEPVHRIPGGVCERLVTSGRDGLSKIWNVRTRACVATLAGHVDSVECVRWGGEGLIYTASRDRTIKVWGAESPRPKEVGKLVSTLKGHGHRVNHLALSSDYVLRTGPFDHNCGVPDDPVTAARERYDAHTGGEPERLVSGSDDFTLFLWHPRASKHPVKRLTGHQQAVNHIAFSPDGRYFASASFDKKCKIWDGRNGGFLSTLTGHVGAVYRVAWSGDSRFLVTASKDSTAKLWEVPEGRRAKETLPGHADEVYALDWSPDGSAVATGSKDRTIKIWKH